MRPGLLQQAIRAFARSRKPPNIESSDCTNAEASDSIWLPTIVDTAFSASPHGAGHQAADPPGPAR